jgi:hypothetical protein
MQNMSLDNATGNAEHVEETRRENREEVVCAFDASLAATVPAGADRYVAQTAWFHWLVCLMQSQ